MGWTETIPVLLIGGLWLTMPGLGLGVAAGLRGPALVGLAPALSVFTVALGSMACGMWEIPWGPWPAVAAGLAFATVAAVLRRLFWRELPGGDPIWTVVALSLGLLLAGVSGLHNFVGGWESPESISQTYDAVFHYNAVATIVDTGKVSPFFLGTLDSPDAQARFYPGVWHALASLIQLTAPGSTVLTAANLTSVLVAVLVWPAGCALLARQVLGPARWAGLGVPLVSLAFVVFPWTLFKWGVLWPNMLGLAMVPAALSVLLSIARLADEDAIGRKPGLLLLPAIMGTCALAHPSALISFLVLAVPIVVIAGLRAAKGGWKRKYWLAVGAGIAVVSMVIAFAHTERVARMSATPWPAFETPSQAVGEALLLATNVNGELFLRPTKAHPVFLLLAGLIVVGAVKAWSRTQWRWLPASHAITVALFVLAAADDSGLGQGLTGLWYNDSYRLAAMLALTGVPLAVLGISAIVTTAVSRWRVPELAAGLGAVSLFVLLTGGGYDSERQRTVAGTYHGVPEDSVLVTVQEREFFKTVGSIVPKGQIVAGSPWNGSPMLYPVAGTRVMFQHLHGYWTPDQWLIAGHLTDAAQMPEVCSAAHRLNVHYLITGGSIFWPWSAETKRYPGLEDPGTTPGFELVAVQEPHRLYRLTACDLGRQNY